MGKKTILVILYIVFCVSLCSCKKTTIQADTEPQSLNTESTESIELEILETTNNYDVTPAVTIVEKITEPTTEEIVPEKKNTVKKDATSNSFENKTTIDWEQNVPETTQEVVIELSPQQTPFG